ncbi:MAG TPA: SRPBCC domain-containing protein [Thermomicrobiales bacterium]|nr:SRPBCC domain-containing protein [Thermomicrobiales bacterium]
MTHELPETPVGATLHPGNLNWTLHMHRSFAQGQGAVWDAITKADLVGQWTPFRPASDLVATGDIWLTPTDGETGDIQGHVLEVNPPSSLRYLWGSDELRFEVSPEDGKTMLDFAHTFEDRNSASKIAAGWHICLAALELLLAGGEVPSVVGQNALKYGWEELEREYDALFTDNDSTPEPMGEL